MPDSERSTPSTSQVWRCPWLSCQERQAAPTIGRLSCLRCSVLTLVPFPRPSSTGSTAGNHLARPWGTSAIRSSRACPNYNTVPRRRGAWVSRTGPEKTASICPPWIAVRPTTGRRISILPGWEVRPLVTAEVVLGPLGQRPPAYSNPWQEAKGASSHCVRPSRSWRWAAPTHGSSSSDG